MRFNPSTSPGDGTHPNMLRSSGMTEEALGLYFAGREQSEREMSRQAYDWRVAAAHSELADRYEALAAVFGAKRLGKMPIDYI